MDSTAGTMHAELYEVLLPEHSGQTGSVRCALCAHACLLSPGKTGLCGVRTCVSMNGSPHNPQLQTLSGNMVAACNIDPIEKKPLYHYKPDTLTFSFGTMGCNLDCAWCQNASISRYPALNGEVRGTPASPQALVQAAQDNACRSVAFTYTEPTVFFELMHRTALLSKEQGLGTLMVSNGFQSQACLDALSTLIDAANIDLKSFRDATYRRYCHARLQPVLDNLKTIKAMGWWLEVTTLVIPGINDDTLELCEMAAFIAEELGTDTPWHLSAFHPCRHMMDKAPTPVDTLEQAREAALRQGLDYVYIGNVRSEQGRNTFCPSCARLLVNRNGCQGDPHFHGQCPECGADIPGIW